jgi:hypothetical protein
MCSFPDTFLFPELLQFWGTQTASIVEQTATLLAKMNILTDPGSQMQLLVDALAYRGVFFSKLKNVSKIALSLPMLITILQRLVPMKSESIEKCLSEDSSKWDQTAAQLNSLEETKESSLTPE